MSENQNRGLRDFSTYDSMKTEELEEILRLDAEAPVGEASDEELLFYVMGVLADRRNNTEVTGKTALEAYESFKQHYLPEEEEIDPAPDVRERKAHKTIRWPRRLTAAAAAVVIVMFGSMTINVRGCNIWETVVTWAQETFHFGDGEQTEIENPNIDDELKYSSLHDVLPTVNGLPDVVPTWMPAGYELIEIIVDEDPLQKRYVAVYIHGEKYLKISVQSYLNSDPEQIEQSEGFVEVYEHAGVTYYLFSNFEQVQAAWINGSYECYISGKLTLDQLKTMIDSIGKG